MFRIKRILSLIALISLAVLTPPENSYATILLDRIVAVVDRDVITWSELYKNMEFEFSDSLRGLKPEERRQALTQYERDYLERLIDVKVQLNEAKKMGISASKEDLDAAIEQIRQKFGLDKETFLEAIEKEGFTYEEYRKRIYEQIVLSKLVNIEIRSKLIVTESEIDSYIKGHGESLETAEGFRLRHIFLKAKSPEERPAAEKRLQEITTLLEKGETFEELAIRYSDDPTASKGGDLGFVKKKDLAKSFLNALDSIESSQYTKPFWSENGVHILYLQEKVTPDRSIRDTVRERLMTDKFNAGLKEWLRSLRSSVYIEVKL